MADLEVGICGPSSRNPVRPWKPWLPVLKRPVVDCCPKRFLFTLRSSLYRTGQRFVVAF